MPKYFLIFFFLLLTRFGYTCSCGCFPLDVPLYELDMALVKENRPETKVIFEGILRESLYLENGHIKLLFDVNQFYKGDSFPNEISVLTTAGDCGFIAKQNDTCLIFAFEDVKLSSLYTGSSECTRIVAKSSEYVKFIQYKHFMEAFRCKSTKKYSFKRIYDQYSCKSESYSMNRTNGQYGSKSKKIETEESIFINFSFRKGLLNGI